MQTDEMTYKFTIVWMKLYFKALKTRFIYVITREMYFSYPLTNGRACWVLIDQISPENHVLKISRGKQISHSLNIILPCLKYAFLLKSLYPVAPTNHVASQRAFYGSKIFVGCFDYQSVLQSLCPFCFSNYQTIHHLFLELMVSSHRNGN